MDKTPLVSIITPFYNTPVEFFQEAVQSVFAQTYKNWELILVDDGSTGQVTQLAVDYASHNLDKVFYFEHENHENLGHSAARNLGIRNSKGKYIAFLDSDDVWMEYKLEQQVAILDPRRTVGKVAVYIVLFIGQTKHRSFSEKRNELLRECPVEIKLPS